MLKVKKMGSLIKQICTNDKHLAGNCVYVAPKSVYFAAVCWISFVGVSSSVIH